MLPKRVSIVQRSNSAEDIMDVAGKVGVITGAASGIGRAVAIELARRKVRAMALVDLGETVDSVAEEINAEVGRKVAGVGKP